MANLVTMVTDSQRAWIGNVYEYTMAILQVVDFTLVDTITVWVAVLTWEEQVGIKSAPPESTGVSAL